MGTVEVVARGPVGRRLGPACRRLLGRLLRLNGTAGAGVTLLLTGDSEVRRLNRRFRRRDRATDVLAFPSGGEIEPGRPHLGEIAVSVERAERQARQAGWSLREETALLVTHGCLHLLGYDHEADDGAMRRLEEDLLQRAAGVRLARRRIAWGEPGGPAAAPHARGGRRRAGGRHA